MEAADPARLAAFWAAVTGAEPTSYEGFVLLPAVDPSSFAMFFQPLTGPRPDRNTSHLDLTVSWGERERTVQRLLDLGAVHQWEVLDEYPHVRWTTLADPEGNLFCIAEHRPGTS